MPAEDCQYANNQNFAHCCKQQAAGWGVFSTGKKNRPLCQSCARYFQEKGELKSYEPLDDLPLAQAPLPRPGISIPAMAAASSTAAVVLPPRSGSHDRLVQTLDRLAETVATLEQVVDSHEAALKHVINRIEHLE